MDKNTNSAIESWRKKRRTLNTFRLKETKIPLRKFHAAGLLGLVFLFGSEDQHTALAKEPGKNITILANNTERFTIKCSRVGREQEFGPSHSQCQEPFV